MQSDWNTFALRAAGQLATHPVEARGAVIWENGVLIAFGMDTEPQPVLAALRDYLKDELICKELGFATSGATWAMVLEAAEVRDDIGDLCEALSEFVWLAWLAVNGRSAVRDSTVPRADSAAKVLDTLRSREMPLTQ
jgi:hypothetical protein